MTTPLDPLQQLRRSFVQSTALIGAAAPDQMELPTPCSEFDVRALIGHMVFAADRIGAVGRREAVAADGEALVGGVADGQWAPRFASSADAALAAWSNPAALEGDVTLPFGSFPAPVVASIYTLEQVTHSWDLASATGSLSLLDPALAEMVLPFAQKMLPAAEREIEGFPFGSVIAVPDDAPAYHRLAGYMGRPPSWATTSAL